MIIMTGLMIIYLLLGTVSSGLTRAKIGVDGGYSGIVIKISPNTPELHCRRIISNLQVKFNRLNS